MGIIGRNGAGKSTLLKILSRITQPTTGRVEVEGRIASLLEVGTGFHPELSGRENIFLNGAILGMSRNEIIRKFDEIVAFAEVDKFLDTPIKRYSSGMYVRLAFAVAAHLEPEILIVDEVLAVGDVQFQNKCLDKMGDVASGGRTVIFVSHNMAAINALCHRAVLLEQGTVRTSGPTAEVVAQYLTAAESADSDPANPGGSRLDETLTLSQFSLSSRALPSGDPLDITLVLESDIHLTFSELSLLLYTAAGQRIAIMDLRDSARLYQAAPDGPLRVTIQLPSLQLVEGEYRFGLHYRTNHTRDEVHHLCSFFVLPRVPTRGFVPYPPEYRGVFEVPFTVFCPSDKS